MKSIFELMQRLFFNIRHRILNTSTQKLFNRHFHGRKLPQLRAQLDRLALLAANTPANVCLFEYSRLE